jgi:hypothetical protein
MVNLHQVITHCKNFRLNLAFELRGLSPVVATAICSHQLPYKVPEPGLEPQTSFSENYCFTTECNAVLFLSSTLLTRCEYNEYYGFVVVRIIIVITAMSLEIAGKIICMCRKKMHFSFSKCLKCMRTYVEGKMFKNLTATTIMTAKNGNREGNHGKIIAPKRFMKENEFPY